MLLQRSLQQAKPSRQPREHFNSRFRTMLGEGCAVVDSTVPAFFR